MKLTKEQIKKLEPILERFFYDAVNADRNLSGVRMTWKECERNLRLQGAVNVGKVITEIVEKV